MGSPNRQWERRREKRAWKPWGFRAAPLGKEEGKRIGVCFSAIMGKIKKTTTVKRR